MIHRIELSRSTKWRDPRGEAVKAQINTILGLDVDGVTTRDVYTISGDITAAQAESIANEFHCDVTQRWKVGEPTPTGCDWAIIVGYRPGVTDNVGHTASIAIGDIIGHGLGHEEKVFSSIEYLIDAPRLAKADCERIAWELLANKLIQTTVVLSKEQLKSSGIPANLPVVSGQGGGRVKEIDLKVSDQELQKISRDGILALSLEEMKAIQEYFRSAKGRGELGLGSKPTDVELEAIAQTWSEHCKHKIFDAEIHYEDENGRKRRIVSCFKTFIKKSTEEIGKNIDWLVSVFHDGAGVVAFNDHIDLAYKVETHNSPSALDPYGGAMTGIVGVNREPDEHRPGSRAADQCLGILPGLPVHA